MNKTAIKNFAINAREKLIADITYKAGLIGVSADCIAKPMPQSTKDLQFFDIGLKEYAQVEGKTAIEQRNALVKAIEQKAADSDYGTAFTSIIEEIAYTWFNRLIAIRFMEVNDYLPGRVRVLSSELAGKNEPDLVTNPYDSDLDFTDAERAQISQLKDQNKLEELFRMLFIKQCNKLHDILPELFETTNDYTELLLNIAFADKDGVVYKLVHDIPEDDFNVEKEGQVEIIGWLYQYYNTVPKDETFALLKKNVKITKERIPAATQLFTSDWIVRYMVENSLGRLWVEGHPNESLKANWKYYLEEAEQEPDVVAQLETIRAEYKTINPEDIKVIDPCMGSGHILVYCFDVLMQIYEAHGYTQRDAAQSILANNLYGLDIDNRAAQLAYFAVMMKARQYDRRIFDRGIKPHVYAIQESNHVNRNHLPYLGAGLSPIEKNNAINEINGLLNTFTDAKEYGSILNVENYNWELLKQFVDGIDQSQQMTLETIGIEITQAQLKVLVEIGEVMARKYHVVVTNPPYMGSSGMGAGLSKYVKDNYPDSKSDLFAALMEKCIKMCYVKGKIALVTMNSWMFLSSYEKMRIRLLENHTVETINHLGMEAFDGIIGKVVQTVAFTMLNNIKVENYVGRAIRLTDYYDSRRWFKEKAFFLDQNRYRYNQNDFCRMPGSPVAYWVSNKFINAFEEGTALSELGKTTKGLITGDNDRFMRLWWEVGVNNIKFDAVNQEDALSSKIKWFPCNKGGDMRKWYGNNCYIVNWENDGYEILKLAKADNRHSQDYYPYLKFRPAISWSSLTTTIPTFRYKVNDLVDHAGMAFFPTNTNEIWSYLGMLNSIVAKEYLSILSPTINFNAGEIGRIPIYRADNDICEKIVRDTINFSKMDWDSFETSWDFIRHPLVPSAYNVCEQKDSQFESSRMKKFGRLSWHYENLAQECENRFNQLRANEEKLNRIFIDIYGLQDELNPKVEDKDVTVHRVFDSKDDIPESMKGSNYARTKRDEIVSLLSYAVGCMFGRYSLDVDGLAYAGGEWDDSKYTTFIPDKDNCIPITDEEYFEDDIVGLFCAWLEKVYGPDTLEENLDFIAKTLGNRGKTSREVIRNYFLNDFFKDHCSTYSVTGSGKRPIYWLFDSGKQNGFKALVYMHRWNADTVGNLRVEYLHRMQRVYDKEIERMQEIMDNSKDNKEISFATKRKEKLQKQLKETREYDEKIAHIALARIDIDLDDGFKENYNKAQMGKDKKRLDVLVRL